jgi:hypothetical protein
VYNEFDKFVEIYNFKLELVHSFKVDKEFRYFKLNNYEIAFDDYFKNDGKLIITCYNYKTDKLNITVNTYLDKSRFVQLYNGSLSVGLQEFFYLDLLGLNDVFLFIVGYIEQEQCAIFIINRDSSNLFKFIRADSDWFIYNSEVCYFKGFFESDKIYAYGLNSAEGNDDDYILNLDHDYEEYKFDDVYLTSNYKYIYSKYLIQRETQTMLKFRVY